MSDFTRIAKVVRVGRLKSGFSQAELSHMVGYKNGQFISNVERALCNVPLKKIREMIDALNTKKICVEVEDVVKAMVDDNESTIRSYLEKKSIHELKCKPPIKMEPAGPECYASFHRH